MAYVVQFHMHCVTIEIRVSRILIVLNYLIDSYIF